MIPITNKTHTKIRKSIAQRKLEVIALRKERDKKREALSASQRSQMDEQFAKAFQQIVCEESKDITYLDSLVNKGAKTTFFEPNELTSKTNFANSLKQWLPFLSFDNEYKHIAKAFSICIEAGDAFLTNKYYVGNGGALAVYLVSEHLADRFTPYESKPVNEKPSLEFSVFLYFKMAIHADNNIKFWEEFYSSWLLLLHHDSKSEFHHNACRFGLNCLIHADPDFMRSYFSPEWEYYNFQKIYEALQKAPELIPELLESADASMGIFGNTDLFEEMNAMRSTKWNQLRSLYMSSPADTKIINDLQENSEWLRRQFLAEE